MEVLSADERQPLTNEDVSKAIAIASKQAMTSCYGYVEREDLSQVCWLDMFEKRTKYDRYLTSGNFNGLIKELLRTAGTFAQREKAAKTGYRTEDLFFYSKRHLRELIPVVLNSWQTGDEFEHEYTDRSSWLDVEIGLQSLSASDYQIICWAFLDDPEEEAGYLNVGAHLGISSDAARQRVNRVLDRLREALGGENPFSRRKAVSNAASMAQTRNQWDGEG